MADRVVEYGLKSLAHHIDTDVSSLDDVYVVTNDFDWNKKPDPADPGNKTVDRALPFAGVIPIADDTPPFTVGNILYEQNIDVAVHVCGSSFTQLKQLTADVKQSLKTAVNAITNSVGVTLYNFAVASGAFFANAGTLQVEIGQTNYFAAEEQAEEDNRKYKSITLITLTAFKDATATLLENKGRVNLTDS